MIENDCFQGHGVEIKLPDDTAFLKVAETLTRMGISATDHDTLYQTCHILHRGGRYAIVHFKEMYSLDGRYSTLSEDDIARRNYIAHLLDTWGLVTIINPESVEFKSKRNLRVIPYKEKANWSLEPKYSFHRRNRPTESVER